MTELRETELREKKTFVKKLNDTLSKFPVGINRVEYEIWAYDNSAIYEYLVMTYKGGAIAVRNCSNDSLLCVLEEISRLAYGGYYIENDEYEQMKSNENFKKILD